MEQGARSAVSIDLAQIEQLLAEHCVAPQLYLQYDLTLQQLAQAIGTNRYYLSQYFSRQGITYNTYINSQRVNHFIKRYEEIVKAGQSVSAQQLAHESGFRSYSTFSRAFMQRTEQTVTAWMRDMEG
jgi:AraC-like DNA-binding protein